MNLLLAENGKEYIIQQIDTDDEELNAFLFSLGCYSGEPITVISRRKGGCTVSIKDGRYNIDNQLAEAIRMLMENPKKCAEMGKTARRIGEEQFDRPHSYQKIVDMVRELVD